jgi:molybdate transport system substrate-binding protein
MQRRSLLAAICASLVNPRTVNMATAAPPSTPSRFVAWPVVAQTPPGVPALNGHTDTVPDIVGRIGANDLVIVTEGNHFPVLLGGAVIPPFQKWAKADPRFCDLTLKDIAVVTLPQPMIVAMLRHGGLKLGNASIEVSTRSGFYPDIVMAGENPLRELWRDGIVRAQARLFARNRGLALLVRRGNPLGIASIADLQNPLVRLVMASATEPGARDQYIGALEVLVGEKGAKSALARETVTFEGRIGIQHRDVIEALAKNHANVGVIFAHLAHHYALTFPDLVEMIEVPGAERFSSTIGLTAAAAPLNPRGAIAFEEFFLELARSLYPRYGFAALSQEEYDRKLDLSA